jgi:NAD(P)-dependent dehydrogenase (short-subunit alcohol dehydrogenase family)
MSRTAIVTGGGRGIGRAITLALAERGWQVVIGFNSDTSAANETHSSVEELGGTAVAVQANIANPSDRDKLVEHAIAAFGPIQLLVNNAGVAPLERKDLLELSPDSYDRVMDTNLKGPFFLTQDLAKHMIGWLKSGTKPLPKIININSISAYTSSINRAEYCISKAGMAMMTTLFADRLAEFGIQVYEIRPGIISTDMTNKVREKYDRLFQKGLTPISRWGQPEDVAKAIIAVTEDLLPYSTGEVINVDGGFHLRRLQ